LPLDPSPPSPVAASWTRLPGAQVKVGVRGSDLPVCSSTPDPADGFGLRSFLPNGDFFVSTCIDARVDVVSQGRNGFHIFPSLSSLITVLH
jgi:hypothetical protein